MKLELDLANRTIYNPAEKAEVVFIETLEDTGGMHTLIEVDVAPGGGVNPHFHKTYSESFECVEGELHVQVGKEILKLLPGDEPVTALPGTLHRFFNRSQHACRFRVKVAPGCRGLEESLQIAYGLARDGMTDSKGTPKNIYHLGILLSLSESKLPGWQGILEKALLWIGKKADQKGMTQELKNRYVKC